MPEVSVQDIDTESLAEINPLPAFRISPEKVPSSFCPDAAQKRVMIPLNYRECKSKSTCNEQHCSARATDFMYYEYDDLREGEYEVLTAGKALDYAKMGPNSPFHMTTAEYTKYITYGEAGMYTAEEDLLERCQDEGMLMATRKSGYYFMGVEKPNHATKILWGRQNNQKGDVRNAFSVLHFAFTNGWAVLCRVNFDGYGVRGAALPRFLEDILNNENYVRIQSGAYHDTALLRAGGLYPHIRDGVDSADFAFMMYQQRYRQNVDDIRLTNAYFANRMRLPVNFQPHNVEAEFRFLEAEEIDDTRRDTTKPFHRWGKKEFAFTIWKNALSYATMMAYVGDLSLQKFKHVNADVTPMLHMLLRRWYARVPSFDIRPRSMQSIYPFPEHYQRETFVANGITYPTTTPVTLMYNQLFMHHGNSSEVVMRGMVDSPRYYRIDPNALDNQVYNDFMRIMTTTPGRMDKEWMCEKNRHMGGKFFPHHCRKCGRCTHKLDKCQEIVKCVIPTCRRGSHNTLMCPILETKCPCCGGRGHEEVHHEYTSLYDLFVYQHVGRHLGLKTARLYNNAHAFQYEETHGHGYINRVPLESVDEAAIDAAQDNMEIDQPVHPINVLNQAIVGALPPDVPGESSTDDEVVVDQEEIDNLLA